MIATCRSGSKDRHFSQLFFLLAQNSPICASRSFRALPGGMYTCEFPGVQNTCMDSMWIKWSCRLNGSYGRGFAKSNAHHSIILSSPNSPVPPGRLSTWRTKHHQLASGKALMSNRKALGVDNSQHIMIIRYRSHYKPVDDPSMWSIIVYDTRAEADPDIVTLSETTSCCEMITNRTTHLIDHIGCQI